MRSRVASLMMIAALLATTLATSACSSGPDGGSSGGSVNAQALVLERCTVCHDVSRIKQAQHDTAGWQSTIARMRGKGAGVDDTEAAAIAEFLAGGGGSTL